MKTAGAFFLGCLFGTVAPIAGTFAAAWLHERHTGQRLRMDEL